MVIYVDLSKLIFITLKLFQRYVSTSFELQHSYLKYLWLAVKTTKIFTSKFQISIGLRVSITISRGQRQMIVCFKMCQSTVLISVTYSKQTVRR